MWAGRKSDVYDVLRLYTVAYVRLATKDGGKARERAMKEENIDANEGRNGEVKERVISFRLSLQEYAMVEAIAELDGKAPNAWARKIVLDEAQGDEGLSRKERCYLRRLRASDT